MFGLMGLCLLLISPSGEAIDLLVSFVHEIDLVCQ